MKLKILHINDLHSRFEELARISTIIKEIKDKNTLILDAGDNADFMRIETEGTKGEISSALLNKIGFHARAFGNNEGFAGKENGNIIAQSSLSPIVTCNLYDSSGKKLEYLQDATIVNINESRVLIIGVTAPYNEFYNLFGIYAKDPIMEVKRVLMEHPKSEYDIVLLLSHLGIKEDKEIAKVIDDIDIIIGGHSHSILEEPIAVNNTIIHHAGDYGQYVGELTIDYAIDERKITNSKGRIIESSKYNEDTEICELIEKYSIKANEYLEQTLYEINSKLTHSLKEENELGNLLADALMDVLNTEFGIINSGVMNKGIEKGGVSKLNLLEICPSPLNPTYIELQGKDLLLTLEKSLLEEFYNSNGRGAGFRGNWLGNIQVSDNVRIIYQSEGTPLNKIKSVTINGKPLELERWYRVGTSDYLQRGTGYTDLANCRNEKYNPEYLRETLEVYLSKAEFVAQAFNRRFVEI